MPIITRGCYENLKNQPEIEFFINEIGQSKEQLTSQAIELIDNDPAYSEHVRRQNQSSQHSL